jgi:hypothetical protein
MAGEDYRCVMSAADFEAIPGGGDFLIARHYEALIDRNDRIGNEFLQDARELKKLTRGQHMLIQLATFDCQVGNGGITQFLWTCTASIFEVRDWLEALGLTDLCANYDRALEALCGHKDRWLARREECARDPDNPSWERFRQSYELLDLKWFDEAYFDNYGYNDKQEWVCQSRGLHHDLCTRLVAYIQTHPAEFISQA